MNSLSGLPNTTVSVQPHFYENILQTIGHTPLIRLNRVTAEAGACTVLAKVEFFNPGGSVKDRIGPAIIEEAERRGLIRPGGTIVEATSGNTGAALAIAAAIKGYRCVFVMPDKMSDEKVRFLRAFGARVVITPTAVGPDDPRSNYNVARRIAAETPNSLLADQYQNPANPNAHYQTTGPELWDQTAGQVDAVVAGMGTGGTITGLGRYLREQNPNVKLIGVDVLGSLLYDTWKLGHVPGEPFLKTYMLEGIGEDFVPTTLDLALLDEVVQVSDREAFGMGRRLVREEGIFCGGSSGAAVAGLLKSQIVRALPAGKIVVVLLPDSGHRYLTKMFDDTWMRENGFLPAGWRAKSVAELLSGRPHLELTTVHPEDRMIDVAALLKAKGISQVPVVDGDGKLLGIVTETDLLEHLLHGAHVHNPAESIAAIVNPKVQTVPPESNVEAVLNAFDSDKVVIVAKADRPVGILTKIDLIDYVTGQIS